MHQRAVGHGGQVGAAEEDLATTTLVSRTPRPRRATAATNAEGDRQPQRGRAPRLERQQPRLDAWARAADASASAHGDAAAVQ